MNKKAPLFIKTAGLFLFTPLIPHPSSLPHPSIQLLHNRIVDPPVRIPVHGIYRAI